MVQDSDGLTSVITQEVLKRLEAEAEKPVPTNMPGGKRLIVLTSMKHRVPGVLQYVRCLASDPANTIVLMSNNASRRMEVYRVKQAARHADVLKAAKVDDYGRLLEMARDVYLMDLDLESAEYIARQAPGDDVALKFVLAAAKAGKPVKATADMVCWTGHIKEHVPENMMKRTNEARTGLIALGIQVMCPSEMTSRVGAPSVGTAPAQPDACAMLRGDECTSCGNCVTSRASDVKNIIAQGADRIGSSTGALPGDTQLARYIDHTLLKPDATRDQIVKLCEEAREFKFASVCVNPGWVKLCADLLKDSGVDICTVIGFPLGATTATTKAIEAKDAIANGANEIDMVINVGALKSGDDDMVRRDIEAVADACRGLALLKVIIETALLTKEEKVRACLLSKMAGADYVKTSTGFGPGGATVDDVALMRATVGPDMGVKASGGIRDTEAAKAMVAAGASRIGASASIAIVKGQG